MVEEDLSGVVTETIEDQEVMAQGEKEAVEDVPTIAMKEEVMVVVELTDLEKEELERKEIDLIHLKEEETEMEVEEAVIEEEGTEVVIEVVEEEEEEMVTVGE